MDKRCSECRHWCEMDVGIMGQCRRNAPMPGPETADGEGAYRWEWPVTAEYEWCGEHTPVVTYELDRRHVDG